MTGNFDAARSRFSGIRFFFFVVTAAGSFGPPIPASASSELGQGHNLVFFCNRRISSATASQGDSPADMGDPAVVSPIANVASPAGMGAPKTFKHYSA